MLCDSHSQIALQHGVTITSTLQLLRDARARGLKVPVLFMGYYNPIMQYGEQKIIKDVREAGGNGFIVCDFPPEEAVKFRGFCAAEGYVDFCTVPRMKLTAPVE